MPLHPAFASGRVAVITGGASGIGLAAARRFHQFGMSIALADLREADLGRAAALLGKDESRVLTVVADVSRKDDVENLKDRVYQRFGDVAVLMNNAGTGNGGGPFDNYDGWQRVIGTNLWGGINGVQAFAPAMIAQGTEALIVNTGSKQGITCPPGDTAYNVSKAGVKVVTEGLQHALRNTPGCRVSAHLLVPGWVHTGLTAATGTDKPPGAWWPEQVVDVLVDRVSRGDFYIICPDNDVSSELDAKRITWGAADMTENRPPLSRWHPDYKDAFEHFLRS